MAIDTAEKRRAAAHVGVRGLLAGPGVTPDAAKDQAWRQQVGRTYSGILAGAVAQVGIVVRLAAQYAAALGLEARYAGVLHLEAQAEDDA